jgi:membrane-bound lytic murein transglycosylase D
LSFREKQARVGKTVSPDGIDPVQPIVSGTDYILYTVKQGDTIWDIIKKFPGVTETEVMRLNNLSDATKIRAGQQLKIKPKS